jgi:carnosine synthase
MKGSQAAENIVQAVRESCIEPFDGVWTPHEATQKLNAQVQKLLGCVGNDPASYDLAQNKYATRRALEKAGINTLKAAQIWDLDDCANAATVVGFPLICKPSTGMGSSGVYKVESMLELEAAVTRILDDIKNSWTLSNCTGGDCTAGKPKQAPILAETFVDPITFGKDGLITEFDVECLVWDGKLVYANVVDNWRTLAPYFQDRGFNAPSVSPEQVQKEMIEYSAAAVQALGFTRGNFHMECWYTTSGPILIEANPRVGGGSIDTTHERVWGVSPMDNFVMAMLDIPINPTRVLDPNTKYGFALVNAEKTGAISDSAFCPSSKDSAIVTNVMQFKFAGDDVVGLDTGVPEWLAQIDYESKGQETSVQDFLDEMARVMDICVSNASRNTTPRLL